MLGYRPPYLQEFADRFELRVPQDLSIVGFDDVAISGFARIALTTVPQRRGVMAPLGADAIADRVERKLKGPPRTTLVGVNLVERSSTAPPSQTGLRDQELRADTGSG